MTIKILLDVVAEITGVSVDRLRGQDRGESAAIARRLAIVVAYRAGWKHRQIGTELNRGDGSVTSALRARRHGMPTNWAVLLERAGTVYAERREEHRRKLQEAGHRLARELRQ